jgi:hypothetical protein
MTFQRIYNLLLRIYPAEYRALFGAEMSTVVGKMTQDRRCQGRIATAHFFLVEIMGLLLGAACEWIAKLAYSVSHSVNYIDGRGLPDPLLMRAPGVSWLQHYRLGRSGAAAAQVEDDGAAGSSRDGCATDERLGHQDACVNAYQTFALASPIRRLAILIAGSRECRHCS